ncbi:hypothetical protein KSP39_PZI016216 [Platanthera zijinensis]|uniref:Uncharacterized protein n=1 Tax=Platanthera zijinensis TaxID=2320716 RepID=A0AAP0B6P0_9ASPA
MYLHDPCIFYPTYTASRLAVLPPRRRTGARRYAPWISGVTAVERQKVLYTSMSHRGLRYGELAKYGHPKGSARTILSEPVIALRTA